MPSATPPINLRVDGLSGKIREKALLERMSWTGVGGELWGILGPNGAGKSTLLSLLASLVPPALTSAGTISCNGQRLQDMPPRDRARLVAYLPQVPETPATLSVGDTVLLGRGPYRSAFAGVSAQDSAAVRAALERLDLWDLRNRSPSTLSGGERQRMHFARILVQDARIWLLDEPYGHLDFGQQARVLDTLIELAAERGLLVLVVAHDLFFLPRAATHMMLLRNGKLLAQGQVAEVWTPDLAERTFGVRFRADGRLLWPAWRDQSSEGPDRGPSAGTASLLDTAAPPAEPEE